ncbi:uncharacterized protein EAF01_012035 [Botrytis porri]|uniref:uncharacterized protein n=1 Tax=Botrytis porri TaxID=87229 RepID=UPI001901D6BD|nr:uncharacterized protein EAF01_012035 [Botrytis porri]KAF7880274.1 hypothetical protein EAF01_012035 [Botrytis porri]
MNPHRPQPQGNTYSTGKPQRKSRCSGFDDSIEVQHLENCLTHTLEAEMERNPSFQIPEVTIYTEPFLLPMFRDEM